MVLQSKIIVAIVGLIIVGTVGTVAYRASEQRRVESMVPLAPSPLVAVDTPVEAPKTAVDTIAPTPTETVQAAKAWKTYTSNALHFSVLYPQRTVMGSTEQLTLEHDGRQRSGLVYVPTSLSRQTLGDKVVPLVMVLHGGHGSAEKTQSRNPSRFRYSFDYLADRDGFITVYPQGVGSNWNDGRDVNTNESLRENVDDVGFLTKLVDLLIEKYPIDADRVYVTGASNGGTMTLRLAEEATSKWAAVASVIASIPSNRFAKYSPKGRLPILIMNATADPLILWKGGSSTATRKDIGSVIPTPDLVQFWVMHNGVLGKTERVQIPNLAAEDGCRAEKIFYPERGTDTAAVVLYTLFDAGHAVPNREVPSQPMSVRMMGKVCMDFDATAEVWEFFKQHHRKSSAP
ncbi:MAG: prolyl oligopeptidase family serine peptidase [Patescibacteria group bacterium]